jgi:putative aminopeptidase FrvX
MVAKPPGVDEAADVLAAVILPVGVSGSEDAVRRAVRGLLPKDVESTIDRFGNLLVTLGDGPMKIVFLAHMDEIGFGVTGIGDDGRVRVIKHGGFVAALYEAVPVDIQVGDGVVRGVTVPRSAPDQGPGKVDDLRVDVGTDSKAATEALGVRAGQVATVVKTFDRLGATRAMGRAMDDRVGCTALLLALRDLDRTKLAGATVTFAWVTLEEVGLLGSADLASRMSADLAVAVDTFVTSDTPLENKRYAYARLGHGCVARAGDHSNLTPLPALRKLRDLAARRQIPLQWGHTGGGNDGSVWTAGGAIDLPLAWPLRSSHSWVELIDLRDLVALSRLVRAVAVEWR